MLLDRIFALCAMVVSIVIPINAISIFQLREMQFVAAVIVVVVTVLYDYIAGLVLGLTLIIIYYRLNWKYMAYKNMGTNSSRFAGPMASLVQEYITPEHLDSAQNNIMNEENATSEMIGMRGVYGEDVYGAQGMYQNLPGFDTELGSEIGK